MTIGRNVRRLGRLRDRHVLVVEDEYLLADQLCSHLAAAGAVVVGPVGSVAKALALLSGSEAVDGAVLDVNLRGEMVFPIADRLAGLHLPFVLASGYDSAVIPTRFKDVARCQKPLDMAKVIEAIGLAMDSAGGAGAASPEGHGG